MTAINLPPGYQGPQGIQGVQGIPGPNPLRHSFRVYRSTNGATSGTVNTPVTVGFDVEVWDPENNFAANAYVCPETGLYIIRAQVSFNFVATTAVGSCNVTLNKNGVSDTSQTLSCERTTAFINSFAQLVSCVAGDSLTVAASASIASLTIRGNAVETNFAGAFLGSL